RSCGSGRPAAAATMRRRPSTRRQRTPALCATAHSPDDLVVAGAAAEVSFQRHADLLVGRVWRSGEEVLCGEEHARQAKATLEGKTVEEGLLHRRQGAVGRREPLDRLDLTARCRNRELEA